MFISDKVAVILITEDPMLEFAVRHLFGAENSVFELHSAISYSGWEESVGVQGATVLLADVTDASGITRIAALRHRSSAVRVLCWCGGLSPDVVSSVRENCDGIVSRAASGPDLIAALAAVTGRNAAMQVNSGSRELQVRLTYRESQLITLLCQGYKNKELAFCLGITTGTVKVYLSTLFKKTGAKNRFELTLFGMKNSLYGSAEMSAPIPSAIAAKRAIARPVLTSMRVIQPRLQEYTRVLAGSR